MRRCPVGRARWKDRTILLKPACIQWLWFDMRACPKGGKGKIRFPSCGKARRSCQHFSNLGLIRILLIWSTYWNNFICSTYWNILVQGCHLGSRHLLVTVRRQVACIVEQIHYRHRFKPAACLQASAVDTACMPTTRPTYGSVQIFSFHSHLRHSLPAGKHRMPYWHWNRLR